MEQSTHHAIQQMERKMKDQRKTDWEQRLYETAKECMPFALSQELGNIDKATEYAIRCADALVCKLKDIKRNSDD